MGVKNIETISFRRVTRLNENNNNIEGIPRRRGKDEWDRMVENLVVWMLKPYNFWETENLILNACSVANRSSKYIVYTLCLMWSDFNQLQNTVPTFYNLCESQSGKFFKMFAFLSLNVHFSGVRAPFYPWCWCRFFKGLHFEWIAQNYRPSNFNSFRVRTFFFSSPVPSLVELTIFCLHQPANIDFF